MADHGKVDFDLEMDSVGNGLIVWRHPEDGPRALFYSAASDAFQVLTVPEWEKSTGAPRVLALEDEGWLVVWAGKDGVRTWFLEAESSEFEDLSSAWPSEARCEAQGQIEQLAWVRREGQSPVLAVSGKSVKSCTFLSLGEGYASWVFAAQGSDLHLDFSGEGKGIAVYQSSGHYRATSRQGDSWIPPVVLEKKSAVERIALAGDGEGRGLVLFSRKKAQALGAHSLAPQLPAPTESPARLFGLERTEPGVLVAAFSEVSPTGEETLYLRRLSQGTWQDPERAPSALGGSDLAQQVLDLGSSQQGYFALALSESNSNTSQLSLVLGGRDGTALKVIPSSLPAEAEVARVAASPLGHALIAAVGKSGAGGKPEFSIAVYR